jgi:hypothetical protein
MNMNDVYFVFLDEFTNVIFPEIVVEGDCVLYPEEDVF